MTAQWRYAGAVGPRAQARMLRELRDGIADAPTAPRTSPDGRHRPYLVTWKDPTGEIRADLAYPTSVVARLEADVAANGRRVVNRYGITPEVES